MDIDQQLQAQSKLLLQKLKARQGKLQNALKTDITQSIEEDSPERLSKNMVLQQSLINSAKARERLAKYKVSNSDRAVDMYENDGNIEQTYTKAEMKDKSLISRDSNEDHDTPLKAFVEREEYGVKSDHRKDRSELTTASKRTIDRKEDTSYNEDDQYKLNFSYSKFNESDLDFLQSSPQQHEDGLFEVTKEYKNRLVDAGNDRKIAAIAREAAKPKSILSINGPSQLKKNLSKVSFLTSRDGSISRESFGKMHDGHLLGYDWISGLLDNDREAMDHSEGYFEELKEFRRINRQECCNDFYNQSPESLCELKMREPSPVQEALSDTRVKPYQVNDRLFTEPIKDHLFPEQDTTHYSKTKKPTFDNPRFVRVSIPRSTLMSPHRIKPQRRSQFEPSDSFALSKHCVMGYESSVPSMVPAASNVGLKDSTTGVKSKLQTTLGDAEKMAASYPFPYSSNMNSVRKPANENSELYKSYMDMTLPSSMRTNIPGVGDESVALKKATDDLLNSTYSMMYELDRIKNDRQYKDSRNLGRVA